MKKQLSLFLAMIIMLLSISPAHAATSRFTDVREGDWFKQAVETVVNAGLFNGTSKTEFSPNRPMTRAMFVQALANLTTNYRSINREESLFRDVAKTAWYYDVVQWAGEYGIVNGKGAERFAPDDLITRQEMVAMFYQYAIKTGEDIAVEADPLAAFHDANYVADWAKPGFSWAISKQIIHGVGNNRLSPQRTATRAEAAVLFANADKILTKRKITDEMLLDMLYKNSYEVFNQCRYDTGVYRDSILLNDGNPYHPSSIAATGIGLFSLPIADKKGWDKDALEKARKTLRAMTGEVDGFKPDVSANGFIRHFIHLDTGAQEWNSEYSSIDTAILVSGALFAKQYFQDAEVSRLADKLYRSIDFQDALADLNTGGIYMVINADGTGKQDSVTLPYNEYIIVAWLAYQQHINEPDSLAVKMWNKWFLTPEMVVKKDYHGIPLLTDHESHYLPSFTLLFPYYMVNMFSVSPAYKPYIENAIKADKLWSQNTGAMQPFEWGNGAGNSEGSGGYHADSIDNNPERTVSPHIISGFLPVNPSGSDDLISLYKNKKGVYRLPNGGKEILWRYSNANPAWKSDSIQAIDYSTFLFGLAANDRELGLDFFRTYNAF